MFQTLFGDPDNRKIRGYSNIINKINRLEEKIKSLTDTELQNQTNIFKLTSFSASSSFLTSSSGKVLW